VKEKSRENQGHHEYCNRQQLANKDADPPNQEDQPTFAASKQAIIYNHHKSIMMIMMMIMMVMMKMVIPF
jgi:hypothetical protein